MTDDDGSSPQWSWGRVTHVGSGQLRSETIHTNSSFGCREQIIETDSWRRATTMFVAGNPFCFLKLFLHGVGKNTLHRAKKAKNAQKKTGNLLSYLYCSSDKSRQIRAGSLLRHSRLLVGCPHLFETFFWSNKTISDCPAHL